MQSVQQGYFAVFICLSALMACGSAALFPGAAISQ
jgi:hypothetical protein